MFVILDSFIIIDVSAHALLVLLVKVKTVLPADNHAKHVLDLLFSALAANKDLNSIKSLKSVLVMLIVLMDTMLLTLEAAD